MSLFGGDFLEIKNPIFAKLSLIFLAVIALFSLGKYLRDTRGEIYSSGDYIKELTSGKERREIKDFKLDYWPEALYIFLILAIFLFFLSLFEWC